MGSDTTIEGENMSLDLAPEIERAVTERAAEEGVSVSELLGRYFATAPNKRTPDPKAVQLAATIQRWQAEDATEDEDELDERDQARNELENNLNRYREQGGMRPLFPG
jgi:hypothetical protein